MRITQEPGPFEMPTSIKSGIVGLIGAAIMLANGNSEADATMAALNDWQRAVQENNDPKAEIAEARLTMALTQQNSGPVAAKVLSMLIEYRKKAQQ